MKLLVFSDSHGSTFTMREALKRNRGTVDYAIHAGDGADDFISLAHEFPDVTFRAVRGNCDYTSPLPPEESFRAEDVDVLVVHGHKFGVKLSTGSLLAEARRRGAGLVIYGHTHTAREEYVPSWGGFGEVQLFNPGAAKSGAFGVIEIRGAQILCSHGNVWNDDDVQ